MLVPFLSKSLDSMYTTNKQKRTFYNCNILYRPWISPCTFSVRTPYTLCNIHLLYGVFVCCLLYCRIDIGKVHIQ